MATTEHFYTGNGSTTTYSFIFPYLKTSDVKVELDSVIKTENTSGQTDNDYTVSNTNIVFNTAPSNNVQVHVYRNTDVDSPAAVFATGSSIRAQDLNNNQTQVVYKTQEQDQTVRTGDIKDGSITSAKILDGTIVNDDINNQAEISVSKLADGSARQLLQTDTQGTGVQWTSNVDVPGTLDVTGATTLDGNLSVAGNSTVTGNLSVTGNITGQTGTFTGTNENQIVVKDSNNSSTTNAETGIAFKTSNGTFQSQLGSTASDNSHFYATNFVDNGDILLRTSISGIPSNKVRISEATTTFYTPVVAPGFTIGNAAINEAELEILDGATVSTAELNTLDGITSSTSELNILDGVTATAAELNALDGITSTAAELNLNDGQTATPTEVNILDGATLTTTELNTLDGITASTTELNQIDGKTLGETSLTTNSDTAIPTSKAVADFVTATVSPLGGLEVINNEVSFPNTLPAAGVVVSISDAGGVVFNGSGVSTTGRTLNGTTVTINGAPSSLQGETLAAGIGLMVSSTGSSQTYNYHKILGKEDDIKQLSDDINDFANRYRVGASNPTSSLDAGDMFFNTGTGKMMVYNGVNSAWEEVQSIGNFFLSTLSPAFDGSTTAFTVTNAPSKAEQLLISINGVIQKPNTGTGQPSEGFTLSGSTVTFGSAPASGDAYFVVVIGSTVNMGVPSNGTVTTVKLDDGAVTDAKVSSSAAIAGSKINPNFGSQNIETTGNASIRNILTISGSGPSLTLTDIDNNPDYRLQNDNGKFRILDYTNTVDRFVVNTDGHIDVGGNFTIKDAGQLLLENGDQNASAALLNSGSSGNSDLVFATGGAERMRLDNSGNLGIGTTPSTKLHVSATGNDDGIRIIDSNNSGGAPSLEIISKRSDGNANATFSSNIFLGKNRTDAKVSSGITLGTINFGGNHTDGTESNISYAAGIRGVASDSFDSKTDMPTDLVFCTGTSGTDSSGESAADSNVGTERMRINAAGHLGINNGLAIGTSSLHGGGQRLTAFASNVNVVHFEKTTTSNKTILNLQHGRATGSTVGNAIVFRNSIGTNVGEIEITNSQARTVNFSDYRMKENIADITNALNKVKNLAPKTFNYIQDETKKVLTGFIAHEVQAVLPQAVTGDKNAVITQALIDSDDAPEGEVGDPIYQKVCITELIPTLTAALKEAITKIETLETKVQALETK